MCPPAAHLRSKSHSPRRLLSFGHKASVGYSLFDHRVRCRSPTSMPLCADIRGVEDRLSGNS